MKESGQQRRLLWSRRRGGHYELLWPPEEEEAEAVAEAEEGDRNESAGDGEVELELEVEEEGQGSGGGQGGQAEGQVWRDVHQIQIQERSAGWRYQGQEGPMWERREVGVMHMGVHTPHTRVRISGFGWPMRQNNQGHGQNYFPLNFCGPEMPFANPKNTVFCVCAQATTVAIACVSASFSRIYFSIF